MKAGINVWTWGIEAKEQFEQGVKEVSDIGYAAVESISTIANVYEDSHEEFDALLERYGVEFACAYHHFRGDFEADYAMAEKALAFLKRHGGSIMNLQAGRRTEGGSSEEELAEFVARATKVGRLANEYGITLCLHPHYNTNVEWAHELDYVMEHLDPSVVSLTLDTAHTVLGGMDPVETCARYAERVRYMHMKDIMPSDSPDVSWVSTLRELGRGIVNFPACVEILRKAGFDGILCVELDSPRICGYKSAAISRQYLRDELGI